MTIDDLPGLFMDFLTCIPSLIMSALYIPGMMIDFIWQNFISVVYAAVYSVVMLAAVLGDLMSSFLLFIVWMPSEILVIIGLYITTFIVLVAARVILKIVGTIWPGQGWLE